MRKIQFGGRAARGRGEASKVAVSLPCSPQPPGRGRAHSGDPGLVPGGECRVSASKAHLPLAGSALILRSRRRELGRHVKCSDRDSPLRRPRSQEPFARPARATRPTLRPARAANGKAANGATSLPRATGRNSVCASPGRLRQTWRWGQRVAGPGEMAPTRRSASISPRVRQATAQPIGSETWRGAFSPWLSAALCCR